MPGIGLGIGDPAMDRTGMVPILRELALQVRRLALNTQHKMKIIQWLTQI